MNRPWKRLGALLLSGAMALSLCACGDKAESQQESSKPLAQDLGFGYVSSYEKLEELGADYVNQATAAAQDGTLYLCGEHYDAPTGIVTPLLYVRDPDSGEMTAAPLPVQNNTETANESIQQLCVCPDGSGLWMVTTTYFFSPMADDEVVDDAVLPAVSIQEDVAVSADAPEDSAAEGESTPEEPGSAEELAPELDPAAEDSDYAMPQQTYTARKFDLSGTVSAEFDLTEAAATQEYFYCQALAADKEGNLYLSTDSGILCFGEDGTRKPDLTLDDFYVQSMTSTGQGTVLVSGFDPTNGTSGIRRVEGGALTPLTLSGAELGRNGFNLYSGDGDTALLSDGTLLYSLDAASGAVTELLSWVDSDINGNNIQGVAATDSGTLYVLLQQYSYNGGGPSYELGTLTKTPADQLPQRTYITLGAENLDDSLQNAVVRFNRNSQEYRVTLVDYSRYNTDEDYTAASKQLDRDIIAGTCPDLLLLNSGNVSKYIAKGALADLSKMLEEDPDISQEDLLAGPLKGYTADGKLYGIPLGFYLSTVYASAKLVGDRDHWTLAEMNQIIQDLDPEVQVVQLGTQTSFFTQMLYLNMGQFVDYSNASCSFDSESFKALLAASAKLPADNSISGDTDVIYDDSMAMVQRGDLLMTTDYGIYMVSGIRDMFQLYLPSNGIVRIGYPTDQGNGAILSVYSGLAISSRSKQQTGAWAFLRSTLDDDVQTSSFSLPITKSAMNQLAQADMKPETYIDENGQTVTLDSYSSYIGDTEYQVGLLTQENLDDFLAYVDGASTVTSYDEELMNIITEEAAAYFAGDKTADEVAKLIDNRVSIYLGETS